MTDPWEEEYIHLHEWLIFMINDGNYTVRPMHGMGIMGYLWDSKGGCLVSCWWGYPYGVLMYFCVPGSPVGLGHLLVDGYQSLGINPVIFSDDELLGCPSSLPETHRSFRFYETIVSFSEPGTLGNWISSPNLQWWGPWLLDRLTPCDLNLVVHEKH